jgi:serine-type D-Ala-D-Ala carboxypeptidase (penicillin-binding protein 5/6)
VRRPGHLLAAALAAGLAVVAAPTDTTPAPAAPTDTVSTDAPVGGPRLGGRGTVPPHRRAVPRGLTARGWLLADLDTGDVLAARDPHGRYPPASTLKILTAFTLLPRLTDRRRLVTCTDADANIEGSRVGLVPKGRYTVDLLFQGLLMMSGNDAASALARAAGGVPRTLDLMNAQARQLQAYDTHAATPSGLDGPGQATSAYDLALITRAGLRRADFRRYVAQRTGRIPRVSARHASFEIANQNQLLYYYPGAFGVKTGFTDAARHTYVGAAARHGRRLVVTFLHGERRPVDTWRQAARLLDWGFALPRSTEPVGRLVEPGEVTATAPAATPTRSPPAAPPATATASRATRTPVLPLAGAAVAGLAVLAGAGTAAARRRRRRRRVARLRTW